jgi:hypothetical protein
MYVVLYIIVSAKKKKKQKKFKKINAAQCSLNIVLSVKNEIDKNCKN